MTCRCDVAHVCMLYVRAHVPMHRWNPSIKLSNISCLLLNPMVRVNACGDECALLCHAHIQLAINLMLLISCTVVSPACSCSGMHVCACASHRMFPSVMHVHVHVHDPRSCPCSSTFMPMSVLYASCHVPCRPMLHPPSSRNDLV